jgi:hypothetical protein
MVNPESEQKPSWMPDDTLSGQQLVHVSSEEYDWLSRKLDEEPREIPELTELFSEPSVFES